MKTRKILSVAGILILIGAVLMIVANSLGAAKTINIFKTADKGISLVPSSKLKTVTQALDENIENIELENYPIEIEQGDKNQISVTYSKKKPTIKMSNKTLSVKGDEKYMASLGNFSIRESHDFEVVLTVKDVDYFKQLNLNTKNSHSVTIEDLKLKDLNINGKNTAIELDSLTSETTTINNKNSVIEINECNFPLLNIEQANGVLEISESQLASGKINQRNALVDFSDNVFDGLEVSVENGIIEIDNEETTFNSKYSKSGVKSTLYFQIKNGNFELS